MHVRTIQCEIAGIQLTPLDDVTAAMLVDKNKGVSLPWWPPTHKNPCQRSPFLVAPLRLHNLFSGRGCCMVQGIKKFISTNYSSFSLLDSSKTLLLSTGEREPLVKRRLLAPPRKSMTPSKTLVVPIERHNLVPRREERPWERNW